MSQQTVSAPAPPTRGLGAGPPHRARSAAIVGAAHRYRWVLAAIAMLVLGELVVLWARTRPGYDPYGWLVWGHLTVHRRLDTNGAPSWKPLPYLFTLPYALAGSHALTLWMATAFAVSFSGVVFAWRVAFKLVDAPPQRRYAAYIAGFVAGAALLGIDRYLHSIFSAESDTMIVALCLAAVDCILEKRYRWAFWMWWLAALGRPEVWAPMGLYLLWAWISEPRMRRQMVAGVLLLVFLWFGIPGLTSKSPFSAASLANNSPRELHGNKITGTISRFSGLNTTAIKLAALIATLLGLLRRDRAVLLLAGGVILWMIVEIGFTLHGFPGVPRYMYEAGAGVCVLAGVFAGRVVLDAPGWLGAIGDRLGGRRLRFTVGAGWAAGLVLLVFAVSLYGPAHGRYVFERKDLSGQHARTHEIALLDQAVARLGGARLLACGRVNIPIEFQSILAWKLGTNTGILYFSAKHEREHPVPVINMYPHSYGWRFFPSHLVTAAQRARCAGLTYSTA